MNFQNDSQVPFFLKIVFECSKGEKLMSEVEDAIFLIEEENDYPMYWDSAIQNFHFLLQGKYSENQATLDDYYQDFDQDKSVSGSQRLGFYMGLEKKTLFMILNFFIFLNLFIVIITTEDEEML